MSGIIRRLGGRETILSVGSSFRTAERQFELSRLRLPEQMAGHRAILLVSNVPLNTQRNLGIFFEANLHTSRGASVF